MLGPILAHLHNHRYRNSKNFFYLLLYENLINLRQIPFVLTCQYKVFNCKILWWININQTKPPCNKNRWNRWILSYINSTPLLIDNLTLEQINRAKEQSSLQIRELFYKHTTKDKKDHTTLTILSPHKKAHRSYWNNINLIICKTIRSSLQIS